VRRRDREEMGYKRVPTLDAIGQIDEYRHRAKVVTVAAPGKASLMKLQKFSPSLIET